jgi:hypothetical protein
MAACCDDVDVVALEERVAFSNELPEGGRLHRRVNVRKALEVLECDCILLSSKLCT